jgi:DNA-binding SARP family transcriptional activator
LLALLLLRAGELIPSDRIIDELWGERPPDSASNAVQGYVSKLRRSLGADAVRTQRPGYVLDVPPDALDAAQFEAHAERGAHALSAGRHEEAVTQLRAAIALWRGPALADFAYERFADREAHRLEERRLAAIADRVDAELALGRHASLVGELEVLVDAHPLDERLTGQLMLALYRAGRQGDALRRFSGLRERLVEELGLDPGPSLRDLELAIIEHRAELAWSRPTIVAEPGAATADTAVAVLAIELPRTPLADATDAGGERLRALVADHASSVVRGGPTGVVATFRDPLDAVEVAIHAVRSGGIPRPRAAVSLRSVAAAHDVDDIVTTCVATLGRAEEGHVLVDALAAAAITGRVPSSVRLVDDDVAEEARAYVRLDAPGLRETALPPAPRRDLPPALAQMAAKPFVGRERVSQLVLDAWRHALDGKPRAMLLSGEPGIGRSRLAAHVGAAVTGAGRVLFGRCDEGIAVPYQPFVEALSGFVGNHSGLQLNELLGRYPEELARLVPEIENVIDLRPRLRSDAATERYRLFTAVEDWLCTASVVEPLVLVLDDLHWATRPTLLLLRHVLRFNSRARVLVIGTYRDTELGRDHALGQLLPELCREPGVERVPVDGLDEREVAQLVDVTVGDRLDELGDAEALAHTIHAETGGNPFFVVEVLRSFQETVERRDKTRAAVEELAVPQGVTQVLGRRLSQLSSTANDVLARAAVIGAEFETSLLSHVAEIEDDLVRAALAEASSARLIEERADRPGSFRFAHALVRDTLYSELRLARRIRLHRAVAEALETTAADTDDILPELAHHFGESIGVLDVRKAVTYAAAAGWRAARQLAPDEAASYFSRAIELLDLVNTTADDVERVDLLIDLGEAERLSGAVAHRDTLLRACALAYEAGRTDQLVRAALANSRGLWSVSGAVDADRVVALERALAMVDPADDAANARLHANLAAELVFDPDHARRFALSYDAVAAARRAGEPRLLAEVLSIHATTLWSPGRLGERLGAGDEALALAEELGDPELLARILVWAQAVPAFEAMDMSRLDRGLARAAALGDELRHPTVRWATTVFRSSRTLLAGDVDHAETLALTGLELGQEAGQPDAFVIFAGQLWFLRYEQGRTEEILDTVRAVIEQVPGLPAWRAMLGVSYCETGRLVLAAAVFEDVAAHDFADLPSDATGLLSLATAALMSARLGDKRRAQLLLAKLQPHRECMLTVATGSLGAATHFLGLLHTTLEDWSAAEACFRDAAITHDKIGAAGFTARTRLEHARMLIARGGRDDLAAASRLVTQAEEAASRLGLGGVARLAAELSARLTSPA